MLRSACLLPTDLPVTEPVGQDGVLISMYLASILQLKNTSIIPGHEPFSVISGPAIHRRSHPGRFPPSRGKDTTNDLR